MRTPRIPSRGDDRGATAVEYGLILALIAVVIIVSVAVLGGNLRNAFASVGSSLGSTTAAAPAPAGPGSTTVPVASRPSASGASNPCGSSRNLSANQSCTVNLPTAFDGVAFVYSQTPTCSGDCDSDEAQRSGATISVGSGFSNSDNATFSQWCYSYAGSATYAAITSTCFQVSIT